MQFFSLGLFTIICGYSLVISAPVNQTVEDSQETKHHKVTAIASRLLKELTNEHPSNKKPDISNENENIGYFIAMNDLDDEQSSSEIIDLDGILVDNDRELIKYLQQLEYFDEDLTGMVNTPIIDGSMMEIENH
ncbi:unnamed protein product [Adineta steineri]|uniref:Uncharacterized protein n=1 Tax=Adineta steineri TaxID=433720 RepID=A0A815BGK2_9BILA|nr:unnamed protein product [Adineta steineri]